MKKALSAFLALALLASLCCMPASAAMGSLQKVNTYYSGRFADVTEERWFAPWVQTAYEYGLMTGTTDTEFSPGGTFSWAEAVAMTDRLLALNLGLPEPQSNGTPWYQGYVDYACEAGYLPAGVELPWNDPIPRVEFVRLMYCALSDEDLAPVNDIRYGQIPDLSYGSDLGDAAWALEGNGVLTPEEVQHMLEMLPVFAGDPNAGDTTVEQHDRFEITYKFYNAGILTGNDACGTFTPDASIDRASVASLVSRVVEPSLRVKQELVQKPADLVPIAQLANLPSVKKNATDAQFAQAYEAAERIVTPLAHLSRKAQLYGIAMALRILTEEKVQYSMESDNYNDPYGFFIANSASCAGCTRATGLCLNMLGIPYEHVNENGYTHQWCRVSIDGEHWICDAYGLYCGVEPAPGQHPYL